MHQVQFWNGITPEGKQVALVDGLSSAGSFIVQDFIPADRHRAESVYRVEKLHSLLAIIIQ